MSRGAPPSLLACSKQVHRSINLGTSIHHPGDNMFYRTDSPDLLPRQRWEPIFQAADYDNPSINFSLPFFLIPQLLLQRLLLIPPAPFRCRSRLTTFRYRRLEVQPHLPLRSSHGNSPVPMTLPDLPASTGSLLASPSPLSCCPGLPSLTSSSPRARRKSSPSRKESPLSAIATQSCLLSQKR